MAHWIDDYARGLRKQTGGCVETLLITLEPAIVAHNTRGDPPLTVHWGNDAADILAPLADQKTVLHEVGHACLTVGLGLRLMRLGSPCWRRQLIRDEAIACRFAAVFLEEW